MISDFRGLSLPEKYKPLVLLLVSGLMGAYINIIYNSTYQIPIEPGQILAGIVKYQDYNLQYIYMMKTWTILNQISAILLSLGFNEITTSIILVGLIGAVSLQALTMIIYAISNNIVLSLTGPIFISLYWPDFSVAYPISYLQMSRHSFGLFGLVFVILIIGLFSSGYLKLGSLLLGMAPAIHFTMGAWCFLLIMIVLLANYEDTKSNIKKISGFYLIGLIISVSSFASYFLAAKGLLIFKQTGNQELIINYIKYLDVHRRPINFLHPGFYLSLIGAIISWFVIHYQKTNGNGSSFFFKLFVINFILAAVLSISSHFPDTFLQLQLMMPGRFININIIMFLPMLLGLLGRENNNLIDKINFSFLILGAVCLMIFFKPLSVQQINMLGFININYMKIIFAIVMFSSIIYIASACSKNHLVKFSEKYTKIIALLYRTGFIALLVVSLVILTKPLFEPYKGKFNIDPVYKTVSNEKGLLLLSTSLFDFVQLKTRRPILFNPYAVDGLPYAPETAPYLNHLLENIYGMSLRYPPEEKYRHQLFNLGLEKRLWERRRKADWLKIRQEFGVQQILTKSDWRLDLPIVDRSPRFILYAIPDQ